ncbi:Hypothetical predicted protein [Marmota monax]|uniref:Uncharacterized protein n=1 Tax=Marmota monax TaxID=9995 RepID=A0A5E4AVC6_MARMO|nr:hypothetical protein GHT09_010906 [Marmota monax]VTJ61314.1 Hypothetical predicted protein [Marmota monax]
MEPATVSDASYAASTVTVAHYKDTNLKCKQFWRCLEKLGGGDGHADQMLVAFYEEPEKPNSALDFLKHHLGAATPENSEIRVAPLRIGRNEREI